MNDSDRVYNAPPSMERCDGLFHFVRPVACPERERCLRYRAGIPEDVGIEWCQTPIPEPGWGCPDFIPLPEEVNDD